MPGETLKIDAFGCIIKDKAVALNCDKRYLANYDVKVNKETGNLYSFISGKTDLVELINSFKNECGLEAMKLAIAKGRDPLFYADDGKHSADCTHIATDVNVAYRESLTAKANADKLLKSLGIDGIKPGDDFEQIIKEAIVAKYGKKDVTTQENIENKEVK